MQFNPARLDLAMDRSRKTARALADIADVTVVSLSQIRSGKQVPQEATVGRIALALGFPVEFFYGEDVDTLPEAAVSFRSLSSVTKRERNAAIAAGGIAYLVSDWLHANYRLPAPNLVDDGPERNPAVAARALRAAWGLGEKPIGNFIKLLEAKGIRVFSLAENTKNVDAFSCWRNDEPFIFLNTFKTTERSRFDAAHELGHLVLHKHGGSNQGKQAEAEANAFASSFLMPRADIISEMPRVHSLTQIIRAKGRWGVSAAALTYRLHKIGLLSDWQYRGFNIQLRSDYGSEEPDSMPRETSALWKMVLDDLWEQKRTRADIAKQLDIPHGELENLLFGLTAAKETPPARNAKPALSVV
ncbi:XRE family transcriptional regulator [Novosphingobium barchaimii LL02]|uniref:XRE family transcriptional regulator n=1 Tax=Novosphingobium barchaimii LL02 TaxID=1114963 RepID=A0A0J7XR67_9SPHN|nr:ImmA/IrrE family metallo-endopeptidase [Novosphingobium barchaimii]KMS53533.1 XRE family transcriptional regulator [Novosphingobium barchaimii LL02]